jgi:hypothetical protein
VAVSGILKQGDPASFFVKRVRHFSGARPKTKDSSDGAFFLKFRFHERPVRRDPRNFPEWGVCNYIFLKITETKFSLNDGLIHFSGNILSTRAGIPGQK